MPKANGKKAAAGKISGAGKKSQGQTRGQYERDPKGRKGQYTGAGDSALVKK
jgi:hypothetical protein